MSLCKIFAQSIYRTTYYGLVNVCFTSMMLEQIMQNDVHISPIYYKVIDGELIIYRSYNAFDRECAEELGEPPCLEREVPVGERYNAAIMHFMREWYEALPDEAFGPKPNDRAEKGFEFNSNDNTIDILLRFKPMWLNNYT